VTRTRAASRAAPLHHDDRAVDDDPEVERADTQQAERYAARIHADEGEEQRERDDERGEQGGPGAQQKHEQDADHDEEPGDEDMGDGAQGALDEVGAVVDRDEPNALGQSRGIQLLDGGADTREDFTGVLAAAHQDDPLDTPGPERLVVPDTA